MFLPSNITLQFGDSGDFVSELQRRLAMVKCFAEDMVNGFYDGNTVNGVTRFQSMVGLHADGIAGPETLRRLNGVIAGGGSTNTDKKEEEKKIEAARQHQAAMFYGHQPVPPENPVIFGGQPAEQSQQTAPPQEPQAPIQQTELPPMQPLNDQHQQQQAMRNQAIAGMLANEAAQQQQQQAMRDQAIAGMLATEATQQQGIPAAPQRPKLGEPPPNQARDAAALAAQQQLQQLQQAPQQSLEVQEKPKGFIGRAIHFASSYLQRLSDYFHTKLAPSTLDEVHQIGAVMRDRGVKEAPIPMGPEMARQATPALGSGGPQQQQAQRS